MSSSERYLRQILVAEIGLLGQRSISSSEVALRGPSLAHEVATLYAVRAGVAGVREGQLALDELAPLDLCEYPGSRQVLAGARAACRALLAAASRGAEGITPLPSEPRARR
jgi:hypothetical protein